VVPFFTKTFSFKCIANHWFHVGNGRVILIDGGLMVIFALLMWIPLRIMGSERSI
jgi:hypothetical protein